MDTNIKKLFLKNGGLLKTNQLEENGVYYRKRKALLEAGEIELVRRGYYQIAGP